MKQSMLNIYDFIMTHSTKIAEDVTECNFNEVANYKNSTITLEESVATTKKLIEYIAESIKDFDFEKPLPDELSVYSENVANRRATSNINAIDLLEAIMLTRNILWDWIEKKGPKITNASTIFALEKTINSMIDKFSIEVTKKFLNKQETLIKKQENSLKIWEEVVKRTSHLDLKIPCTGEFVLIARAQAEAIASRLNMTREEIDDFVLVIGEACDNAIEHGFSDKGVDIHYMIMPNEIMVKIIDYGKGFNPEGKGEDIPDLMAERGRGIFIMKSLATSVKIDSKPGLGTTVTITKKKKFTDNSPFFCCA